MMIRRISNALKERISYFKDLQTDFAIPSNPVSVNAKEVPQNIKLN